MSIWSRISTQFGRPTGIQGRIAGMIMASRASNLERTLWALSLLDLRPADRVLEIGFGPGVAIHKMSEIITEGIVWGVDHSEVMFKQASRRNSEALSKGMVKLFLGTIAEMPPVDGQVDKVLDINSFQFWRSPVNDLKKLRTFLAPNGIIAIVHQPRKPGSTDGDVDKAGRMFAGYLESAGFRNLEIRKRSMKPVSAICILGRRGNSL